MKNLWRFLKYWFRVYITGSRFYAEMHRDYEDGTLKLLNDINFIRSTDNISLYKDEWQGAYIQIDSSGSLAVMNTERTFCVTNSAFGRLHDAVYGDIKVIRQKRKEAEELENLKLIEAEIRNKNEK